MTPLVTSHIDEIDQARMAFIERLLNHINKLRDEMRINELILHSVLKSLSSQTDEMAQLDMQLHQQAVDGNRHKPFILTAEEQQRLSHMQDRLQRELQDLNKDTNGGRKDAQQN